MLVFSAWVIYAKKFGVKKKTNPYNKEKIDIIRKLVLIIIKF